MGPGDCGTAPGTVPLRFSAVDSRVAGMAEGGAPLRILVLGAGVIGSVYAGKLLQAGHEVVLLARGPRLSDLRNNGLV